MISGETLRQLRNLKGIKQKTLAKELGVSQPAYCKLEQSEKINGERLPQLMKVLGYTIEEWEDAIRILPPPENELSSEY